MLKLGEKGAILQRDKETYAIAPHVPCGVVTPALLRKLADIAEKYNARAMKITGATRIAVIGLREEDIDKVWEELGMSPGAAVGLCVRSVRACPGNTYCRLGQGDALGMGMKLDKAYHGMELPNKLKISVSGCNLNCAESWVRDIGLVARKEGWEILIGGNVGANPRIAKKIASELEDEQAMDAVAKIIAFYKNNAKKGERMGKTLERMGTEPFEKAISG